MTTDAVVDGAAAGVAAQQAVGQDGAGQPGAEPTVAPATPLAALAFTAEQQAHIDRMVSERLERERKKQQAAVDRAKADAEAAQAAERGEFQKLYEAEKQARSEAETRLRQAEFDQLRRDVAQAAGIPQLWERLRGETAEALAEDAKALAAMMQPAAGRPATTPPTPQPQAGGPTDFVKQAIERQQKRATENDPYAAMMKR